jgi:hypothetical protein
MQSGLSRISIFISLLIVLASINGYGQSKLKLISLPKGISGVNEEFSGMTTWKGRVYLEPQYGDHKETKLDGAFNLYSIKADSIGRVLDGKDTVLTKFETIKVINLNKLPDSVKQYYEGFEALTIVNKQQVYLSIETTDTYDYCFLLKGTLDTVKNVLTIDPRHYSTLKRPLKISNAGFESVTYLPEKNKLIAYYEFNGSPDGGTGYLLDTSLNKAPEKIKVPFLYFRITDIATTSKGQIYGINYFWNGDYDHYLNNGILTNQDENIKATIPDLRDSITNKPDYLRRKTFARIVTLRNYKDTQWKQVASFDGYKNNWEGITLFRKGALIITDANRSSKQLTTFAYLEF